MQRLAPFLMLLWPAMAFASPVTIYTQFANPPSALSIEHMKAELDTNDGSVGLRFRLAISGRGRRSSGDGRTRGGELQGRVPDRLPRALPLEPVLSQHRHSSRQATYVARLGAADVTISGSHWHSLRRSQRLQGRPGRAVNSRLRKLRTVFATTCSLTAMASGDTSTDWRSAALRA